MSGNLSWVSEYWLECIGEFIPKNRIKNVIEYSKTHHILYKQVKKNCFHAKIGLNKESYVNTEICFKKFSKIENRIINSLKYQTKFVDSIENDVFPIELYDELFKKNVSLFPTSLININLKCDCSKQNIMCDHIIAVLVAFALELEKDPLLLFTMKGSSIKNLQYKDFIEEKNSEENSFTNITKSVKDLFSEREFFEEIELEHVNYKSIPDLSKYVNLLEDNTSNGEHSFRKIIEKLFKEFSEYLNNNVLKYDIIKDDKYNDFINLELPAKFSLNKNNSIEHVFNRKWGNFEQWRYLTININSNYSITRVNTGCKDAFSSFKSEKIIFAYLTELSHTNKVIHSTELNFLLDVYELCIELIKKNALIPESFICNDKILIRWIPPYNNEIINKIIHNLSVKTPESIITFNMEKISKKTQVITLISLIIKGFIDNYLESISQQKLKKYAEDKYTNLFLGNAIRYEEKKFETIPSINKLRKDKQVNYTLYMKIIESDKDYKVEVNVSVNQKELEEITQVIEKTDNKVLKEQLINEIKIISRVFPNMNQIIENKEDILLTANEFSKFFNEIIPLLEARGVILIIPKDLRNKFHPKISLNVQQNTSQSYLSLDELFNFDWKIALGDVKLSLEEFKKLTSKNRRLVRLADRFITLDESDVEKVLREINQLPKRLSNLDLIKSVATGKINDINLSIDEKIKKDILSIDNVNLPLPEKLNVKLRKYQIIGYKWLAQNMKCGFGSILADDMGLGKTVQVLTLILKLKEEQLLNKEKVLIIAPTSVLINWQREIEKFTPDLTSYIYHGSERTLESIDYDIIITSYAIARKDKNIINKHKWLLITVDEAQNIKNEKTKQTKAIKSIKAKHHIALSGTPIENRLSEYWSIFDFTNKGYLGNIKDFRKTYIAPIENHRDKKILNNLKMITQPFILRRLKTNKEIINELPEKISNDIYCNLTTKQATLYQETLNVHMESIKETEGIARRGRVLELITALKQICNHPTQYIKSGTPTINDSGKMQLLINQLETILENDEKVLIFTQYVKTGHIIKNLVEKHFDTKVLFLHGSLSRKTRDKQITNFQEDPSYKIFILSLKAGGTGLNLTAANNVIHYDLWWNPAVEDQATDRAYRIGQESNVMVYRLITTGTFEEKINEMIDDKRELAEITISDGGTFITEMSDEKLNEILKLRQY